MIPIILGAISLELMKIVGNLDKSKNVKQLDVLMDLN